MGRRTPLAADTVTRRRNRAAGQDEQWNARSADGRWDYERLEDGGTNWRVTYRPSITADNPGGRFFYAPSLPKARAITARPATALALLSPTQPRPRCSFISTAAGRQQCPEPPTPGHTTCTQHGGTQ